MMIVPEEVQLVKKRTAGFEGGTIPSWLTSSGVGSVTANDATNDGGYALLSTGTGASGDESRLQTAIKYQPDAYDVISLRTIIEWSTNDTTKIGSNVMFADAEGGPTYRASWEVHTNILETRNDDTREEHSTQVTNMTRLKEAEIRWHVSRGEIELFLNDIGGGIVAGYADSAIPDPTVATLPQIQVTTLDTAADRSAKVHLFEVGYYTDMKKR